MFSGIWYPLTFFLDAGFFTAARPVVAFAAATFGILIAIDREKRAFFSTEISNEFLWFAKLPVKNVKTIFIFHFADWLPSDDSCGQNQTIRRTIQDYWLSETIKFNWICSVESDINMTDRSAIGNRELTEGEYIYAKWNWTRSDMICAKGRHSRSISFILMLVNNIFLPMAN